MVIKIDYTSSDVYVSTSVSPVYVVVNYSGTSGGGVWGQITGTLSNQTDLQTALDGKFDDPTGDTTQYIAGDGSLVAFPIAGQAGTLVREVRNITGATLTKGTVVYINGASGNKPTVTKALATGDSTSAQTFGIVQANIANNSNGYVVAVGDIDGLNTSAFADGAQLYLSATTAGAYTDVKQYAPNHLVYIGVITRSHPTQGRIEVRIQNGYELDEIHNVAAQNPSNNDALIYESSTSLWKNKTIATALGYTPQASLTLTTTGTSGAATLVGATLNIPQYSGGGGGTPGGSNTYVQYNDSGAFQGSANFIWDNSNSRLVINGQIRFGTSGNFANVSGINVLSNNTYFDSLNVSRHITSNPASIFLQQVDGNLKFQQAPTAAVGSVATFSTKFEVFANGRFATGGASDYGALVNMLGTTSDALQIGNANYLKFGGQASGTQYIKAFETDFTVGNAYSGGSLILMSGNASSAKLTAAGRLLLGTTSESTYLLDVNGTARVIGELTLGTSSSVGYQTWIEGSTNTRYTAGQKFIVTYAFGTVSFGNNNAIPSPASGNKIGFQITNRNAQTLTFYEVDGSNSQLFISANSTNTGSASAIAEFQSTTQGFLPPRMTATQKNAIATPAAGLMVFDTTLAKLCVYSGTAWETITSI